MGGFKGNEFAYTSDAFNSSLNQNNATGISKRILRKNGQQNAGWLDSYLMAFVISLKEIKKKGECKVFEFSYCRILG